MVSIIELLGWQSPLSNKAQFRTGKFRIALLRKHISPNSSALKPSSALASPRVATPPKQRIPVPHWQISVALLRKHVSSTTSAPRPSSALAPPRVANPLE
ncbi:hypothetical protein F511_21259 [Dorcoceras hygrometricum]|uniref:Uncharacterized protein n=1 Tax=Dorcoceras hygrometricum TaxID=472368 RepID=A0A2Z7D9M4_9LAMI|nr:hypothetical protein F511_21259 [Dorcoceras hygrometricum]